MKRGSGTRGSRSRWLRIPLVASSAALVVGSLVMAASPAYAVGGKIPITPGATVPIETARQMSNMYHDAQQCIRTTSPAVRAAVVLDYQTIIEHLIPELAAAGNTLVVPTIGWLCPQSGISSNITPGGAPWVPIEFSHSFTNARHDAVTCAYTTDPVEYAANVYDYNLFMFAPGTVQDKLIAEGDNAIIPPIKTFCPVAP